LRARALSSAMKLCLALLLVAPLAASATGAQKPSLRRRSGLDEPSAQRAPRLAASALRQPSTDLLARARGGERMGLIPVYKKEMPMFFTFAFMMFCTIFIFTMARDTKDTLVVTSAGAEAIAFLKVYFVIPASMLFFLLYSKMSNVLSKRVLFASTMLPFIAFYALFGCAARPL
jgi:hypothetical protein